MRRFDDPFRRLAALGAVLAVIVIGACTESDLAIDADGNAAQRDESGLTPDETVDLALDDIRAYWERTLPELYGVGFAPLAGGLVPYGPSSSVPQCGEQPLEYEDIAENALYCPKEDLIAWDRVGLIPDLQRDFGPLTVGVVMAHEYAHAAQSRGGVDGSTLTLELQADCFAGSWVADVGGRIDAFDDAPEQLDDAIGGFLELRDSLEMGITDPQAHGTGFDRISAFQDGYEQGARVCVEYETEPPSVVVIPPSIDDLQTGGNLPIVELLDPLLNDLERFYDALFTDLGRTWDPVDDLVPVSADDGTVVTCGDEELEGDELLGASLYCSDDDSIYLEDRELLGSLDEIGDFAVGGEIARLYAVAAQERLGLFDAEQQADEGRLHADCLTGVYAAEQFAGAIPGQELRLSPGDLDEVLIAFLTVGEADADTSAFERTTAFRSGFVDGYRVCEPYE